MKVFMLLIFVTTSSATFHKLKPHKLYKTLVEPFIDGALQGIFTGGILDPIGHFITGGKSKHHKKKYHKDHYYEEPHYYHEREFYVHHGGHPPLYPVPAYGGYHHCGSHDEYHHHHQHQVEPLGYYGPPPYAGHFHYDDFQYGGEVPFDHNFQQI